MSDSRRRAVDQDRQGHGRQRGQEGLEEARATLGACLTMNGAGAGKGLIKPAKRGPTRAAAAIVPGAVLTYVRNNPGSSGEQIASEAGTDTATLRPVLRELIAAGTVTTTGKGRGTRYAAG